MKKQMEDLKLRLMVFQSARELGEKVDYYLKKKYGFSNEDGSFLLPIHEVFFSDGHLKVEINDTVRGKDVYLLTDIGNYSLTYSMHGFINHMSPNDYMQQLRDALGACNGHANSLNVIMPLLFAGRQHRRNTRENLACGQMLHELSMQQPVKSIITFDAHDQGVEHAVFNTEFDNFFATNTILKNIIHDLSIDQLKRLVFVAPDNGATGRRNVYLNSFNCDWIEREAGSFIKQRDYNHIVNGKNPILSHDYCGNPDLNGKTAFVVDDMISSGGSMFDVIKELKSRGVKYIYLITTFSLFTSGIEKFRDFYEMGMFDGLYTTNLTYIPKEFLEEKWLHICDCSKLLSKIIYNLQEEKSISGILNDKAYPLKLLRKKLKK